MWTETGTFALIHIRTNIFGCFALRPFRTRFFGNISTNPTGGQRQVTDFNMKQCLLISEHCFILSVNTQLIELMCRCCVAAGSVWDMAGLDIVAGSGICGLVLLNVIWHIKLYYILSKLHCDYHWHNFWEYVLVFKKTFYIFKRWFYLNFLQPHYFWEVILGISWKCFSCFSARCLWWFLVPWFRIICWAAMPFCRFLIPGFQFIWWSARPFCRFLIPGFGLIWWLCIV